MAPPIGTIVTVVNLDKHDLLAAEHTLVSDVSQYLEGRTVGIQIQVTYHSNIYGTVPPLKNGCTAMKREDDCVAIYTQHGSDDTGFNNWQLYHVDELDWPGKVNSPELIKLNADKQVLHDWLV